jgi:hypothetical protein
LIRYAARRLLLAVPTLLGIVILVFGLLHLAPGSPVSALGAESGRRVSARAAEEMRKLYGLDRPLPERFAAWAGRVARFDLGESFVDRRPVSTRIREALPYTLLLNGLALLPPGAGRRDPSTGSRARRSSRCIRSRRSGRHCSCRHCSPFGCDGSLSTASRATRRPPGSRVFPIASRTWRSP